MSNDGISSGTLARVNARAMFVIFCLSLVAAHAGGLGIAPLMAIAGIIGVLTAIRDKAPLGVTPAPWMTALALFLAWAFISGYWSPYNKPGLGNAVKFVIGAALYILAIGAFFRSAEPLQKRAVNGLIIATFVAAFLLFIDTTSGYSLSLFVDPVRLNEDPVSRLGDAQMNVSQGIVMMNLIFAPIAVLLLWIQKRGPFVVGGLIILNISAAIAGGMMAGVLALAATVGAMAAAYRFPQMIIKALTYTAMGLVGFAPLLGALIGALPQGVRDILPFSWEHRIVTWGYTAALTSEAPITGHGFDAARTFNDTFSARGFDGIAKISLHPHNAGLHIWLETGAIGALLAVSTIFLLGRQAQEYAHGGRARALAVSGTMAAIIVIASVSYGVWQEWWWALIALSIGLLAYVPQTRPKTATMSTDIS